ncbi:hypothetical protein BOX15_Mlig009080g1, partial [Macrostomum lignano]
KKAMFLGKLSLQQAATGSSRRQLLFLPPLSPYDQIRTRWTRIIFIFALVPLLYQVQRVQQMDESDNSFRSLQNLSLNDRLQTHLAFSQANRNKMTFVPLEVFEGGKKFHLEIPLDDLCEKGFRKASQDCLTAAMAAADSDE